MHLKDEKARLICRMEASLSPVTGGPEWLPASVITFHIHGNHKKSVSKVVAMVTDPVMWGGETLAAATSS